METRRTIELLFWILIALCWIPRSTQALKCHVCHSIHNKTCGMPNGDEYLTDCKRIDEVKMMNHTNCRKETYSVESAYFNEKVERIIRSCGYEKHSKYSCYFSSNKDLKGTTCECTEDGCNTAETVSGIKFLFLLPAVSVIINSIT